MEVLKRICSSYQTSCHKHKMPTPSDIIKTAIICVKRDVLPPIVTELNDKIDRLEDRIKKLEALVENLLSQK